LKIGEFRESDQYPIISDCLFFGQSSSPIYTSVARAAGLPASCRNSCSTRRGPGWGQNAASAPARNAP